MVIKTAIELGMEDMRKNPWLLDDALSDCVENQWLRDKFGQKQIDAFKEWYLNNKVDIYMRDRNDKDSFPCVTISLGSSSEKEDMKSMADQSTESVTLLPQKINKPIPFVVKPFAFTSYDSLSGELVIDSTLKGMSKVSAGMIVVDPDSGKGYVVQDIGPDFIALEPNLTINATRLAIIPKNQFYVARREHTFFQETYSITCHAHGDPQTLLWLWTIVVYTLLRYRESMFEAQGFSQSTVSSSNMDSNGHYTSAGGEQVWSRTITLTGMVENSWIKAPKRVIESVSFGTSSLDGLTGGIKIISESDPEDVEEELG